MYKNSYINNFVKYIYEGLAAETLIIKQEAIKLKIYWGLSTKGGKVKHPNLQWNHELFHNLKPVSTY